MRNDGGPPPEVPPNGGNPPRRRSASIGMRTLFPPPPPPSTQIPTAPVFERFHSFKEFMALQKDGLEPERAVELYTQYQFDYKVHTARMQFAKSQELGFVRERFRPENIRKLAEQKVAEGSQNARDILQGIADNAFQNLCLEYKVKDVAELNGRLLNTPTGHPRVIGSIHLDVIKGEDEEDPSSSLFIKNLNEGGRTLVMRKLPADTTRDDILEACHDIEGITSITLLPSCLLADSQSKLLLQQTKGTDCTEEELIQVEQAITECYTKTRNNTVLLPLQTCWIEFLTKEQCEAAELALEKRPIRDLCTCHPFKVLPHPQQLRKVNLCAIDSDERCAADLNLATKLIHKLDKQFNIYDGEWPPPSEAPMDEQEAKMLEEEEKKDESESLVKSESIKTMDSHPFLKAIEQFTKPQQRDLCVLYLRRVHAMDFFSGKMCWSSRELFETTGVATLRLTVVKDVIVMDETQNEWMWNKVDEGAFDARINALLAFDFSQYLLPIGEDHPTFLDLWARFCEEKTMVVDSEKFRCSICRKLFKGSEFVHKHLRNKHANEVEPVKNEVRQLLMKAGFEADEGKLLLFVAALPTSDRLPVISTRPLVPVSSVTSRHSDYGPTRRIRGGVRSEGPLDGQPATSGARPYRDWDAPRRTKLQDKVSAGGGCLRAMIRYDDL